MMSKNNICIFTISMSTGGTERVIHILLKHLVKDYNVTLVLITNTIDFDIPEDVNILFIGSPNYIANQNFFYKLRNLIP